MKRYYSTVWYAFTAVTIEIAWFHPPPKFHSSSSSLLLSSLATRWSSRVSLGLVLGGKRDHLVTKLHCTKP